MESEIRSHLPNGFISENVKWIIVVPFLANTNTNTGIFTVFSTFHSLGFFFCSIFYYGTLGTIQSNHNIYFRALL